MMTRSDLCELAISDLLARRGRWTATMLLATVVLVSAICLASYGVIWGKRNVERKRIEDEAWSLVLRAGNSLSTRDRITPEMVGELRESLAARFRDPAAIRGVFPFRTCVDRIEQFVLADKPPVSLRGRTVHISDTSSDLYLSGHKLRRGSQTFQEVKGLAGMLITPDGLQALGIEIDATLPQTVTVSAGGQLKPIDVIGVFEKSLPDYYDFVITESQEAALRQPETKFPYILSGPLPDSWVRGDNALEWSVRSSWQKLPKEITDRLQAVDPRRGRLHLQAKTELSQPEWQALIEQIAAEMRDRTGKESPEFCELDDDGQSAPAASEQVYDLVNVYVAKAEHLRPAADECDQIITFQGEGTVNRDIIHRVESIDASFQSALQAVNVQQGVIAVLALFCLAVLQFYRAVEKTPEIGMLRAMGMRRRDIGFMVGLQALLLASVGSLGGILLGVLIVYLIAFSSYDRADLAWAGASFPLVFLPVIFGAAAVINLFSNWLASWRWLTKEPAVLLRC